MTYTIPNISRHKAARIAGFFYLVIIITGMFAELFVREALMVPGNAMATAHNIQTKEMLYRWGFVADLINYVSGLPVILIFYLLFRQVNKHLALLALFFVLIQTAIGAVNLSNQLSPLLLLSGDKYLQAFQPEQLAILSKQALLLLEQGYAIGLVFFGFYCIIIGFLMFKSAFMPRLLGIGYAIAGAGYLANSFIMFLTHKFANPLFPYILIPPFIGEASVCLWLLIMGVKNNKQALAV